MAQLGFKLLSYFTKTLFVVTALTTIIILFVASTSVAASNPNNIERGSFDQYFRSLNDTDHGYLIIKDVTGSAPTKLIEVFEVRPGDCNEDENWSDCDNDRERSELSEGGKTMHGDEYWYGWSIYFPKEYSNIYPTKTALGQFHQKGSHPVWMFQNGEGGYHLDEQTLGFTNEYHQLLDEDDLYGKWHKVEVHVRWSRNNNGFFKVWLNDEQQVDYSGVTTPDESVYFKYGIYRSFLERYKDSETDIVPEQKVYYSNVKRGKTRSGLLP